MTWQLWQLHPLLLHMHKKAAAYVPPAAICIHETDGLKHGLELRAKLRQPQRKGHQTLIKPFLGPSPLLYLFLSYMAQ